MATIRPEDLGGMGESFFKSLCKSVGLIANRSDDDKGGWDYEIEHPRRQSIDYSSHAYPVYRIQVKSTLDCNLQCRITYSNLLNLIQYHGAAFIVLLVYDGGTEPNGVYLRHIDREFSLTILKRIRRKQLVSPCLRLNKRCAVVRFDSTHAIRPIEGHQLTKALARAIGHDYLGYVQSKVEYLKTFERDGKRREGTFTFKGRSELTSFANCLLGFRNDFKVDCELYNAPLGIRDGHPDFKSEGLVTTVDVRRADIPRVFITLKNSLQGKEYRFPGLMYALPSAFPADVWATRIETPLFDLVLRTGDSGFNGLRMKDISISDIRVSFRELYNALDFLASSYTSEETFIRLESDSRQQPAEIRLGKAPGEVPRGLSFIHEVIGATYLRIRERNLDEWEISTRDIISSINHCHCISLADKTFNPPYEVPFESASAKLTRADVVIFKAAVSFVRKNAFVAAVAFFGTITKRQDNQFDGRFDHSRTLGEYIVSIKGGKEDPLLLSEEDRFRAELTAQGHIVL